MDFILFPHKGIGLLVGFEAAGSGNIEAATIVITYVATTGFKQGIPYLIGM